MAINNHQQTLRQTPAASVCLFMNIMIQHLALFITSNNQIEFESPITEARMTDALKQSDATYH
jgi:hypothetical protein